MAALLAPGARSFQILDMPVPTAHGRNANGAPGPTVADRGHAPPRIGAAARAVTGTFAIPGPSIATRAKCETSQWLSLCEMAG